MLTIASAIYVTEVIVMMPWELLGSIAGVLCHVASLHIKRWPFWSSSIVFQ